jgi:hypothetical protein
MKTLTDAKGITFLTNDYDSNGRVQQQTQADASTYQPAGAGHLARRAGGQAIKADGALL